MIKRTKIVICHQCNGEGEVKVGNVREMHNHDTEKCDQGGGSGKLKRTVTISFEKI